MIKILILEDNKELAKILLKALKSKDRKVNWVDNLKSLHSFVEKNSPDLCILDRLVADGDSIDSMEYLKEISPNTKYIFLTRQNKLLEKIVGLEKGADDYLTKPFSLAELRIKVRNMLSWGEKEASPEKVDLGLLSFFPESGCLMTPEGSVQLRKRESELVFYLTKGLGRTVTKKYLLSNLWKTDHEVKTNTVDVYIKRLRKRLGRYSSIIKTVRGFGYQISPYKTE
jgi:two-component system, OmpR family, alkaline phosphatase synthesis response regulator PhoP